VIRQQVVGPWALESQRCFDDITRVMRLFKITTWLFLSLQLLTAITMPA